MRDESIRLETIEHGRTVLNAVRTPLALGDFAEDNGTLPEQLVDDTIDHFLWEMLLNDTRFGVTAHECMLNEALCEFAGEVKMLE